MKLHIDGKFGIAPNELLNNPNISLKAKGLYAYLQSKPDNWKFSIERISKQLQEGEKAIRNAMHELENAGYLERIPIRQDNKFMGYDYCLKSIAGNSVSRNSPSLRDAGLREEGLQNGETISKKDDSKKDIEKSPSLQTLGSLDINEYDLLPSHQQDKLIAVAYSRLEEIVGKKIPTGARVAYTPYLETLFRDGYTIDQIMKAAKTFKEKLRSEGKDPYMFINFKSLSKMIEGLLSKGVTREWF